MTKVRPFHCGSQYADWEASNCERCTQEVSCDIRRTLLWAYFDDGYVPEEIGRRMGYDGSAPLRYSWPCSEVEWTEEWKAEYNKRFTKDKGA